VLIYHQISLNICMRFILQISSNIFHFSETKGKTCEISPLVSYAGEVRIWRKLKILIEINLFLESWIRQRTNIWCSNFYWNEYGKTRSKLSFKNVIWFLHGYFSWLSKKLSLTNGMTPISIQTNGVQH
jgi:hypothetical protein